MDSGCGMMDAAAENREAFGNKPRLSDLWVNDTLEYHRRQTSSEKRFHHQLRADDDRRLQTSIHWAVIGEEAVHAAGGFPVPLLRPKLQPHMNSPDDQYIVL